MSFGEAYDRERAAWAAARKAYFTYRRIEYRLRDRLDKRSVRHALVRLRDVQSDIEDEHQAAKVRLDEAWTHYSLSMPAQYGPGLLLVWPEDFAVTRWDARTISRVFGR